jgi:MFS family permease
VASKLIGLIKPRNNIVQAGSNLRRLNQNYRLYPRNIKAFLTNVIFSSIGAGVYEVLISLYFISLGYSETFIGVIFSVGTIALGLFAIPAGIISDKIGRKFSFLLSRVLMIVSLFLLLSINNPAIILINIALFNISQTFYIVSSAPFIADVVPEPDRVRVSSIVFFSSFISITLGNLLSGILPSLYSRITNTSTDNSFALRFSLYLYVVLLFISLIAVLRIEETSRQKASLSTESINLKDLNLKNFYFLKGILPIILAATIINFGVSFIIPFFPIYFKNRFNAGINYIGLLFSLSNIPLAFASLLSGRIVKRFGMSKGIAFCQFLGAPFSLMIGLPFGLYFASFAFTMRKILLNFYGPIWDNFFMNLIEKENRGKAIAFINFSVSIIGGIGTAIAGYFYKERLYIYPFIIATTGTFIAAFIYYRFEKFSSLSRKGEKR